MFDILRKSWATGVVTTPYPATNDKTEANGRGRPRLDFAGLRNPPLAADACATGAITWRPNGQTGVLRFDLGACTFCGMCAEAEPAIRMTNECEVAYRNKEDFIISAEYESGLSGTGFSFKKACGSATEDRQKERGVEEIGAELKHKIGKLFGRSLHIREVDAGSCNGCEVEIVGLNSPVYDIERFGIHFVASPRHADMLLVTGPVSRNMHLALRKTYEATPKPRLVIAVGACGCSGGIFRQNYASLGGVDQVIPVDVYVPGCPPGPRALLKGILTAIERPC